MLRCSGARIEPAWRLPHSRPASSLTRVCRARSARARAENCYCYVCDAPATGCPEWSRHCKATHASPQWQAERAEWGKKEAAKTEGAAGSSSSAPPAKEERWSCDMLLSKIEQARTSLPRPHSLTRH